MPPRMEPEAPQRSLWRDSVAVAVAGQVERVFGVATALVMRLGLAPEYLGVYSGLRLLLDNTNRSSLGVGLGAVQEIPILRASGREAEAERVANVAFTANTITCAFYAAVLLVWAAFGSRAGPLGSEWTWGLAATGGLVLLKRYESFLTAILRSHGEFGVTARLDAFEAVVSLTFIGAGVWLAGFAGLLGAVALIVASKILFLHASHPLRFRYRWDWSIARRLMRVGLPIFANTATFGALISLDRMLILGCLPDGERAAGLYSAALLATNWGLDLAGRLAIVLYPHLQATLGRTGDTLAVARGGMRAVEHQAPLLFLGGAIAFAMGPEALGALLPNYREGLAAIGPLAPGMAWLGLAWPARQALTTLGRNRRLFLASAAGLLVCTVAGFTGATRGGTRRGRFRHGDRLRGHLSCDRRRGICHRVRA